MTVETTVADLVVGLETPLALLGFPVVAAGLWALIYRRADGTAGARSRRLLLASRLVVAALVILAVAGPYTVATRETTGDPRVTLLVDESDSMDLVRTPTGLAEEVQAAGVPTRVATIGNGTRSRLGDGIAANLRENGSVVVVSDGQVTGGQSLDAVADRARSLNATVSRVELDTTGTERRVTVSGPAKTSEGVETTFLVSVRGVETTRGAPVTVNVSIDGVRVDSREVAGGNGTFEVAHLFNETGPHRVTARLDSDDPFDRNDVYRRTVRVVERPKVLYVSDGTFPLFTYLAGLYDVETDTRVPSNLSEYYAVVVQNKPAPTVGDVDELQRFVIDGNGLVVVGGDRSFENGNYGESSFGSMLPVTTGESGPGSARIVLAVDVSGSAEEQMRTQKAIALDVLNQLGDRNEVGLVAFNFQPYAVAEPRRLGEQRAVLEDRIRRLTAGGATDVASGLRGAEQMLGEQRGTVILVSDGRDPDAAGIAATADDLGRQGIRVITVGVGNRTNEDRLRRIATESGGTYLRAGETDRLRLRFGGGSRQFRGEGLTVVDPNTFVTSGVELQSNPGEANDVSVRRGADLLVATSDGKPALARWRYGLGRVATVTTYGPDGTLDGLLERPDSLLVTKTVNYAVGDPERKATGIAEASDTRVGRPTTVVYRGTRRPAGEGVTFRKVGAERFEATVTPRERGFQVVAGAEFAANYHPEYAGFGESAALKRLVRSTGGRTFSPAAAGEIAQFARERATAVREVRDEWDWLALVAAFLLFFTEVAVRRIQVYRGRTANESGLT